MPQISIITVNYNNKAGLERTINSVAQQVYQDYEHIIIDAASNDGSLEVILNNKDKFSYWVSEKDRGIYHGMNKGIAAAKGEYLLFLNSGDYLIDNNALNIDYINYNSDLLIGYHTTLSEDQALKIITYDDKNIDLGFFIVSTLPHSSTLIKKSLFDSFGYYDETYKICADWVFFYRAVICEGSSVSKLQQPIGVFELGGVSTNKSNKELVQKERERFLNKVLDKYSITYIREIYPLLQENSYLKKELEDQKEKGAAYYKKISSLKGIGLLVKLNQLFGS